MNQLDLPMVADGNSAESIDELQNRLQSRLGGRVRQLQLFRHDDGVVLRGFARTYHAKQMAQHAVMSETSLPILANEIEVG